MTRILIFRLGSLGDTLIALPALRLIAQAYPLAERRLLTSYPPHVKAPPSSSVLQHTGLIHGYLRYTTGTRSLLALLRLWWQILRWRPQVLVYLGPQRTPAIARRDARFFRLAGIRRLVALPLTEESNRCLPEAPAAPGATPTLEPEAARLVRNLAELYPPGFDPRAWLADPASWSLALTPAEHARAADALAPLAGLRLLAVSLGTKVQAKDWGVDNWRELLTRLAARLPAGDALVLLGAPEEAAASDAAAQGWRSATSAPALNLCGALSPRESAAVLARCLLLLGHDSGPMHLAAAVQTPCVALFAARNLPRVWFPWGKRHRILYHPVECAGCGLETCIVERKRCLLSISVEEVLQAFDALLREVSETPPGSHPA